MKQINEVHCKRDKFYQQIRRQHNKQLFSKVRKQLMIENELDQQQNSNINQIKSSIKTLIESYRQNKLSLSQSIKEGQIIVDKLKLINYHELLQQTIYRQLFNFIAIKLLQQNQYIKQYIDKQTITHKTLYLIYDLLAEDDYKVLPFLKDILPITLKKQFIQLYNNIFLNDCLDRQLKHYLIKNFLQIIKKQSSLLIQRYDFLTKYLYYACERVPRLQQQHFQEIHIILNKLYSVMQLVDHKTQKICCFYRHTLNILAKSIINQDLVISLYRSKHLWKFVLERITFYDNQSYLAILVLAKLLYYDFIVENTLREEPKMWIYIDRIFQRCINGQIQHHQTVQYICYLWNNVVLYFPGCQYFLVQNYQFGIFELYRQNKHCKKKDSIFTQCCYIMVNILTSLKGVWKSEMDEEDDIETVLTMGGLQIIIQGLTGCNAVIFQCLKLINMLIDLDNDYHIKLINWNVHNIISNLLVESKNKQIKDLAELVITKLSEKQINQLYTN